MIPLTEAIKAEIKSELAILHNEAQNATDRNIDEAYWQYMGKIAGLRHALNVIVKHESRKRGEK